MTRNLNKKIITLLQEANELGQGKLSMEQKKQFMDSIAKFNQFGKSLYSSRNLKEIAASINDIVNSAEQITLSENDEWFDKVTVSRNVKGLKDDVKLFNKTCQEAAQLQQRIEALYEDIGSKLNRYFHIDEITESMNESITRKSI